MDVDASVVVQDVEADCDYDIQVGWFEDKEVFVLVLEHKLVDKRILLQLLQLILQFLHVEMAAPVGQDP